MSFFNYLGDWINNNPGKALGAFLGFVLGILIFTIGFIKTLLIVLLVAVGYIIGKTRDDGVSLVDSVKGLFRRRDD